MLREREREREREFQRSEVRWWGRVSVRKIIIKNVKKILF